MSGRPVEELALKACAEYERWQSEAVRLSEAIGAVVCPNETPPEDPEWTPGRSCFSGASSIEVPSGPRPDDGPRRISLASVRIRVSDCPACTRLCDLITERRHARRKVGAAKRLARHVGKRLLPVPSDSESIDREGA